MLPPHVPRVHVAGAPPPRALRAAEAGISSVATQPNVVHIDASGPAAAALDDTLREWAANQAARPRRKELPVDAAVVDGVVVAGTFDHLHAGHKIMLSMAALACTKLLLIAVAGEPLSLVQL